MKTAAMIWRLAALLLGFTALAVSPAAAQQRGTGVVQHAQRTGARRALVVGISHYLYLAPEKQLNYAAADAEQFYQVLRSKAGGALPDSNIRKLLNDQATAGRITADLGWLVQASKPGDEAIIYFAGHGDVESLTGLQGGFLLATDAPTSNYFAGGTVQVSVLGQFVAGITQRGATVLVITDACRSGKLIDEEGAKRTTAALLEAWNGVAKLVSSAPEQSSWEGAQWGGGHGVFTYFVIAGLEGLADANGDGIVTLKELWLYVDQNVENETGGKQAPPLPSGDPNRQIAAVDTTILKAARAMLAQHQAIQVAARGAAGDSTPADTVVLHAAEAFQSALNAGALLEPAGVSAWDRYRRLAALRAAVRLLPGVRGTLAAAFQDDAQKVILDYLAGGNTQPPPARLRRAATELRRARELLGATAVLAGSLRARQLFFEGYASVRDGRYRDALDPLQRSVALERDAAYAYNALGFAYLGLSRYADARQAFADAQRRAPRWSYPAHGLALVDARQGHRREAETEFKRAIEADSTYLAPRVELASLYMQAERPADAERMLRDEIRLDSLNFAPSNDLGALLLNVGDTSRYAEAEATLRRAARLAPQSPLVAANLGLVYQRLGRPTDAEREYRRAIALNPLNADRYAALGAFYYGENRLTEAEAAFGRGAAVAPRSARLASLLGWTYRMEHRPGDAEREYRRALTLDSLNFARSNQLGLLLLESKRPVEAELLFRRAARLAPQAADSADVADNLGLALRDLNQPVEAERAFRRAIRLDSLSYLWHFHLAQVLADSSRYVEAAGALRRAAGLAPRSAEVAGTLAWMYAKLDQATDTNAEHEYRRAMALDSLDFSWPNQLGLLLVSKGRYEEGQALFQRALHLAPQAADSADVADNLGVAYRKLNQPAAAELEFRRAIRFDSLSRLGPRRSSAGESHDNKRAGAFRRARAVVPRAADAAGERAWLAAKLNRPAYAERAYKPGLALFEGKPTDKGGGEVSHGDRARFADLLPGEKARVAPP